jgi:putative transposase
MKYQFIQENQPDHDVELMARLLKISRSGYYAWMERPICNRSRENSKLIKEIRSIQKGTRYTYGSPRVTKELKRRGFRVGHNRIARLIRENGLGRRLKKPFRSTTDSNHDSSISENLLNRDFGVAGPNMIWVSDLTFISTAEGWLYLCVIIDLYSRKVVGWSMDSRMKADLVIQTFLMAFMRRKPGKGLIFHSDRGSQYCSKKFRRHLEARGVIQSMSRKGDPWDNAVAESFFKTLKSELTGERAFKTRIEARTMIFKYIEVFYNQIRLHSSLGYDNPASFEKKGYKKVS